MARYKFQFETGHIYDGPIEVVVNDFIGEVKGEVNPSLVQTIEAHGGQLIPEKLPVQKPEAKKRKVNPVKWSADNEGGEK